VSLPESRVLAVDRIAPAEVPIVREDADHALALTKASPDLRRAVGDTLDQYAILDLAREERVSFAAQALPIRSSDRNDPCSVNRCLDLTFRTATGYLPWRAHVDLTRRTGGRSRGRAATMIGIPRLRVWTWILTLISMGVLPKPSRRP
jgi:hypothetical protein